MTLSSKSREHRMRVLANQSRAAAELRASEAKLDPQLKIPLIVEVKQSGGAVQRKRRVRRPRDTEQPELEVPCSEKKPSK
jgi:hypothetical protein